MKNKLNKIFTDAGVDLFAPVSLTACEVTRPYKLTKAGFSDSGQLCAIMLAIPYLTRHDIRNISAYAVSRDYHLFFKQFFSKIVPQLQKEFPEYSFAGFADDSPINERDAAAMAGLGIIGENGLLITDKYSSYVFLGEIITDLPIEATVREIKRCCGCGKCRSACPMSEIGQCLSALTQKKGELGESEEAAIAKYGVAWGCDICQEVCPHTLKAINDQTIYTNFDFFKEECIPLLSTNLIDGMSDEEFEKRAYSWRKRDTIRRNLKIIEENTEK